MKWRVDYGPVYSVLKVELAPGEDVWAEPGALMLLRGSVEVETSSGGILRGLRRALLGGESFFMNHYVARSEAEIWLVPGVPGDIRGVELAGEEWVVQDTSYLAHAGDLEVDTRFRGLGGLLAEGQLFWLSVRGTGTLWVTSYGAVEEVEVPPGETMILDNYHLVAMPASTEFRVRKFGGLKSFLFGGEGLVLEIHGPAKLLVQTRILPPFAQLLARFMPKRD